MWTPGSLGASPIGFAMLRDARRLWERAVRWAARAASAPPAGDRAASGQKAAGPAPADARAAAQRLIRLKLAAGWLPDHDVSWTVVTAGAVRTCDGCGQDIAPGAVTKEGTSAASAPLSLHADCFDLWEAESKALVCAGRQSSADPRFGPI